MSVDLRDMSLKELLERIAKFGVDGQLNSKNRDSFKVAAQIRMVEVLADELANTRQEGHRASGRLFWLNIVLTLATLAMGVHAVILIYQLS